MPRVKLIHPDETCEELDIPIGTSVMQGAVSNGVKGIVGECGGSAMCATCHVYVEPRWRDRLPGMQPTEDEMLECTISERRGESRLCCQIRMSENLDGLTLRIPEAQQ